MKLPALILCALACACKPDPPKFDPAKPFTPVARQPSVPDLAARLAQSETNYLSLAETFAGELVALADQIRRLEEAQALEARRQSRSRTVELNFAAKGFSVVETEVGKLLVMNAEATPYLAGYSVKFLIGNPMALDLTGIKVTARWGPRLAVHGPNFTAEAIAAHLNAQRTNTVELTDTITAGSSTAIELKVTPADAASIQNLRLEFEPKSVFVPERRIR